MRRRIWNELHGAEYQRNLRKAFKQKCQTYLGGICVHCGTTENLTFSHNDPSTKSFELGNSNCISKDWETIIKPELDKCSLRCRGCHRLYDGQRPEPVHGTLGMYDYYKCRCDECREVWNTYQRVRLAAKGIPEPGPQVLHGTLNMYTHYGCRCQGCRDFWANRAREFRTRKKLNRDG